MTFQRVLRISKKYEIKFDENMLGIDDSLVVLQTTCRGSICPRAMPWAIFFEAFQAIKQIKLFGYLRDSTDSLTSLA